MNYKMDSLKVTALKSLAKQRKIPGYSKLTKKQLVELLNTHTDHVKKTYDDGGVDHCDNGVCKLVLPDDDKLLHELFESYRSIPIPESITKKLSKKALYVIAKDCNITKYQTLPLDKLLIEIVIDDVSQLLRESMN